MNPQASGRGVHRYVVFGAFSVAITLGFFWDGIGADYSALSGDQYNILAICAKRDHPQLLRDDLIVGNPSDVAYYTPVFVNLVRVASLPDHNYLRGLNILLAVTSLVYMWGWWLLFSVWGDIWIAAISAFFVRGVLWPPGNELWGIAGIWTMLPRTLFLALLPWVLWLWFWCRRSLAGWLLTCVACGLLANLHPISGLGVAVALLIGECAWTLGQARGFKTVLHRCLLGGAALLLGLAPYIWVYLSRVSNPTAVDLRELDAAIRMRIPVVLLDPSAYFERWMRPELLVLVLVPWLGAAVFVSRRLREKHADVLVGLGGFALGCILVPIACFPLERLLGNLGFQVRFAFQLIRTGKYVLVPVMVVAVFVLTVVTHEIADRWRHGRLVVYAVAIVALTLTLFARSPLFDRVPVLGNDIARLLWPRSGNRQFPGADGVTGSEQSVARILPWIRDHTPEGAKFVGPRPIRAGSLRAVVHDWAGAVVLIEGNPLAFVEAAKRQRLLRDPRYSDPVQRSGLLASWGADYWVTKIRTTALEQVHEDGNWYIYRLRK